jgi:hypothetical protein
LKTPAKIKLTAQGESLLNVHAARVNLDLCLFPCELVLGMDILASMLVMLGGVG